MTGMFACPKSWGVGYVPSAVRMARRSLTILALGVFTSTAILAEPSLGDAEEAKQLLSEMSRAMRKLDYRGTVVYLRDNRIDTHLVYHANINGIEQEHMVALNSPMREIIRKADLVTCYFPDSKTIIERRPSQRSLLVNLPDNIDALGENYRFLLGDIEYVVQRETQIVKIDPRDQYRYGRVIWIDVETKLPLKFELHSAESEPLEQMVFTDIDFDDLPAMKQFDVAAKTDLLSQVGEQQLGTDEVTIDKWHFRDLPAGFRQVFHINRKKPTWSAGVEHIMLSDGFASVSVYIEEQAVNSNKLNKRAMGAIHSAAKHVEGYRVTVLGEVPQATVDWIADAVVYSGH